MAQAEASVREARLRRDAARARLDARIALLQPASLRGRAIDTARGRAVDALETGLAIARESKGVIAAVVVLLALWFMRRPIVGWLETIVGAHAEQETIVGAHAEQGEDLDD